MCSRTSEARSDMAKNAAHTNHPAKGNIAIVDALRVNPDELDFDHSANRWWD